MKLLIMGLCLLVLTIVTVAIRAAGVVLGGLPTVILYAVFFFLPVSILGKKWDEKKETKRAIREIQEHSTSKTEGESRDIKITGEASGSKENGKESSMEVRFCRKCGEKLIPGSSFCRQCGTRVIK